MEHAHPDAGVSPAKLLERRNRLRSHRTQRIKESGIVSSLISATVFSVLVTLSIIFILGVETTHFFLQEEASLGEFFGQTRWNPLLGSEKHFGIWPLVCGTFLVAGIALLVAVPMGLATAIYLSEYANPRVRAGLKPALEILAGIPTVVYGFFALILLTPSLKMLHEGFGSYNALAAGMAVGILILPTISSLAEDEVKDRLRHSALSLSGGQQQRLCIANSARSQMAAA